LRVEHKITHEDEIPTTRIVISRIRTPKHYDIVQNDDILLDNISLNEQVADTRDNITERQNIVQLKRIATLQALIRRSFEKRSFMASKFMQALLLGRRTRRKFEQNVKQVRMMQSLLRTNITQRQLHEFCSNVVLLQSLIRRKSSQRAFTVDLDHITTLQSLARSNRSTTQKNLLQIEKQRLEAAHRELQAKLNEQERARQERQAQEQERKRKREEEALRRQQEQKECSKRKDRKSIEIEPQKKASLLPPCDTSLFQNELEYDKMYQIHFRFDSTLLLTLDQDKIILAPDLSAETQRWLFTEHGYIRSVHQPNIVLEIRNNVIRAGEKMQIKYEREYDEHEDVITQEFDVVHTGFAEKETKFIRLKRNNKMILGQSVKSPEKLVLHVLNYEKGLRNTWLFKLV
jgi:hypothetical protein